MDWLSVKFNDLSNQVDGAVQYLTTIQIDAPVVNNSPSPTGPDRSAGAVRGEPTTVPGNLPRFGVHDASPSNPGGHVPRSHSPACGQRNSQNMLPSDCLEVGKRVEVWSESNQRWFDAEVEKSDGNIVTVLYVPPNGQQVRKQLPVGHGHLRVAPTRDAAVVRGMDTLLTGFSPARGSDQPIDVSPSVAVGTEVEVWSESNQMWVQGEVEKIDGNILTVLYVPPNGQQVRKQLPVRHGHLRMAPSRDAAVLRGKDTLLTGLSPARGSDQRSDASPSVVVGTKVEVWSESKQMWVQGEVETIEGTILTVLYVPPNGQQTRKQLPVGHDFLRVPPSHDATNVRENDTHLRVHPSTKSPAMLTSGDDVEVWSESQQSWLQGHIKAVNGDVYTVSYTYKNGATMLKDMPASLHGHIRRRAPKTDAHKEVTPRELPHDCSPQDEAKLQKRVSTMAQIDSAKTHDPKWLLNQALRDPRQNNRWSDKDFLAGASALCHNWQTKKAGTCDWRTLKWCHAHDFVPRLPVMRPEGARGDHVQQGSLGDCYFLAAVSAFAKLQPDLMQRLVTSTEESSAIGVSACSLSWNGRWTTLLVSHEFPCHPWGPFAFAKADIGGLWVPLLEKAWAKLNGSYQAIEGGVSFEAFRALSGAPTVHLRLDDARNSRNDSKVLTPSKLYDDEYEEGNGILTQDAAGDTAEGIWKALAAAVGQSFPICASCGKDGEEEHEDAQTGLIRGHAYTVVDARISRGMPFVRVRNPWGKGKWHGASAGNAPSTPRKYQDEGDGAFWMKYSEFIQEFNSVDVCRMQEGFISECVDVHPQGKGSYLAFFRLSSREGCDGTISVLRHKQPSSQEDVKEYAARDRDSFALELISMSRRGSNLESMSGFHAKYEVALEASLKAGVEYLLVVRAQAGLGKASVGSFHVVSYTSGSVGLKASPNPDEDKRLRAKAFEVKVSEEGDVLWEEDGSSVRCWRADQGDITAFTFDAKKSRLFARFEWCFKNMLLQPQYPEEPAPKLLQAASAGEEFEHEQIVDLQIGERQMVLLSWVQPQQICDLHYSYSCGNKPCSVCGVPIGVVVPGRFSGEYFVSGAGQLFGKTWYLHAECKNMKDIAGAASRKLRRKDKKGQKR